LDGAGACDLRLHVRLVQPLQFQVAAANGVKVRIPGLVR
jgi:hypothetical protein